MGCFSARPVFAPPAKWHGQYVAVFFSRKKRVFEQKKLLLSGERRDFRDLTIVFSAKLMVHGVKDMSLLLIHFWSPVSEKSMSLFPCPKERPKGKRLKELNGRRRYRFFPLFLLPLPVARSRSPKMSHCCFLGEWKSFREGEAQRSDEITLGKRWKVLGHATPPKKFFFCFVCMRRRAFRFHKQLCVSFSEGGKGFSRKKGGGGGLADGAVTRNSALGKLLQGNFMLSNFMRCTAPRSHGR